MGVCAGLADYFGCSVVLTRLLVITALLWFDVLALIAYFALGFLLPTKPETSYDWDVDEIDRGSVRRSSCDAFRDVRHRLRQLEMKLQHVKGGVISTRYELDRQFRDLEH